MADEKGSFGLVGKAWETAKIYNGSNLVRHFDGIVEADSLKTLGEFARGHILETRGIDFDSKEDDRLARYNMVKLTPTKHLDEVDNPTQMYLITDEKGHDIGTYEITENGPVFHLAPRIKEHNDRIMEKFQGEGRNVLEREYNIDSLEDLTEKLAKGKDVALTSEEQAKDEISEEYEKRGIATGDGEAQDPEEKDVLDKVPADMRGEAVEFAREKGLQVKEILIVDNPETLAKSIDNRENQISENGGPVILIKAKSGKALDLDDDVYALQDGQAIQDEKNDKALNSYMKEHEDEGHVTGLEPLDNNELLNEAQRIWDEAQKRIEEEEEAIAQLEYNKENIDIDEGQDQDVVLKQLDAEIEAHQNNIGEIAKNRDLAIKELLGRASREKTIDIPEKSAMPEENEGEAEKNRWDSANPYNGPKN